jgi:hypothetical protein
MAIDFGSLLTDEQKASLIQQRISQFAAEAYQHSLNKSTAEQLGALEEAEKAVKSLELLETAIKVHQDELNKLNGVVIAEAPATSVEETPAEPAEEPAETPAE